MKESAVMVIGALLVFVAGCGTQRPATYPVHGKVVFADGSPLQGGTVEFRTAHEGSKSIIASGIVAEDGTFQLTTFEEQDGAVAGTHQVIVRPKRSAARAEKFGPVEPLAVDRRFFSYNTSGLEETVIEGDNEITLRVERPVSR